MTKHLRMAAALTALAATCATCCVAFVTVNPVYAQAKTPTPARYTSKSGFSFAVPAKWRRDDADISRERTRYTLTTEDGRVVASIKISTLRDTEITPESLTGQIRETVKQNTGTILIVRDKAVTVGNASGTLIETNNTRASDPDTEMTLALARNGVTGQVVLTCKTADRAKYAPVFDKIVQTFKWQ